MARKDYYVVKDTPHPLYKTRMLTAGVPIPLDASAARLFGRLGVRLSEDAPKPAAPKVESAPAAKAEAPRPTVARSSGPKPKTASKRRTVRKKTAAKK